MTGDVMNQHTGCFHSNCIYSGVIDVTMSGRVPCFIENITVFGLFNCGTIFVVCLQMVKHVCVVLKINMNVHIIVRYDTPLDALCL